MFGDIWRERKRFRARFDDGTKVNDACWQMIYGLDQNEELLMLDVSSVREMTQEEGYSERVGEGNELPPKTKA